MEYRIIIAGFGGQGVLFAGKVLSHAAASAGYEISWLPSYGPEMRGGTANCQVVISDTEISSPAFTTADFLIAMNTPSYEKFAENITDTIITSVSCENTSDINARIEYVDCTGNENLVNMVALGHLAARLDFIDFEHFEKALKALTRPDIAAKDLDALKKGCYYSGM